VAEQPLGALEVIDVSVGENNKQPSSPDVVPDVADAGNRGRFGGLEGPTESNYRKFRKRSD
jgi:hypothetical protein